MRVLVAGASGMIGTELVRQLVAAGHDVVTLVRREARAADEAAWAPEAKLIDTALLNRVDAVVNLSGASLSKVPWTPGYKKQILESRLSATATLAAAMGSVQTPPAVFISGSAVGYYGDRPNEQLTEESPKGQGFLADVVGQWEAAAHRAPEGTRVVTIRSALVIGRGGAMKPLLPLVRLGLGGPLGSGHQQWPWVSLHDEAAAIVHLLDSSLSGPVNVVGPTPATAAEVVSELAAQLHRPYGFPAPAAAIRLGLGDAGKQLLLASQLAVPAKLLADGFVFRDPTIHDALARMLARP